MKKLFKAIAILLFISLLQGCSYEEPQYLHFEKKPCLNYYTKELTNKILKGESYSLEIFDTNISKTIKIDDSEKVIVEQFLDSLTNDSYKKSEKIDSTEPFQFRIKFNDDNDKYVIKIYDNKLLTVSPWDGNFETDCISMDNVPGRYNLYNFCIYVETRSDLCQ